MRNKYVGADGVFVCGLYRLATQNAINEVSFGLDLESEILEGEGKNDFKKAFKLIAKYINKCKQMEIADTAHADEYRDIRSRLTIVYALVEKILNDEFNVDTKNVKYAHDVQNNDERVIKPFIEQVYRMALKTIPNEMQEKLHLPDDLLVSYHDEPNNWIKACSLVSYQIKLSNSLYEKTGNELYLFVARRLYALQCIMTNTVRTTLGIDIAIDEQGSIKAENKQNSSM